MSTAKKNTMERHYGILTRTDWNSNKWQDRPTEDDLVKSEHNTDNEALYSSLNFAHNGTNHETTGVYQGFLYQFAETKPKPEDLKYVDVVFIQSKDIETGKEYITGLYAFPMFAIGRRDSPYDEFPYLKTNIKTVAANIHRLENYLDVEMLDKKFFPLNKKKKGKLTYSYLTKGQVEKILDTLTVENPGDQKLHSIKFKILKSIL